MRITALNRIFGMLAASPNATLSVFGKDGSAKDSRRRAEKSVMRPAGLRLLPLSDPVTETRRHARRRVGQGRGDMMPIS